MQGDQQVVLAVIQQGLLGQRAGRDDAHHLALDRSLGGGDVADLFTDRHGFTLAHQSTEVLINRMHRDAGHGNRVPVGFTA